MHVRTRRVRVVFVTRGIAMSRRRDLTRMREAFFRVCAKSRRRDAGAQHALGGNAAVLDGQAAERGAERRRAAARDRAARRGPCRRTRRRNNRSRRSSPHSEQPLLAHAAVARVRKDHVVDDVDPHQDARRRPAAASAPRHPGSAPDRPTDGCGTARSPRRRRSPPRGRSRAGGRCSRRACRPSRPSSGARGAWCRAARRRTARPPGCRIAAAASRPGRAGT